MANHFLKTLRANRGLESQNERNPTRSNNYRRKIRYSFVDLSLDSDSLNLGAAADSEKDSRRSLRRPCRWTNGKIR